MKKQDNNTWSDKCFSVKIQDLYRLIDVVKCDNKRDIAKAILTLRIEDRKVDKMICSASTGASRKSLFSAAAKAGIIGKNKING